jgi:hypothetical protein
MDFGKSNDDANPFAKFWADWGNQMMGMAAPTGNEMREAVARQMRQAFFDAWARCCEEFLGSEAFLEVMKRSMDASLAFRQQLNELMSKTLHESQAPTRSDTDSILLVLHGLEDRLLSRMDQLSDRIAALEVAAAPSEPIVASKPPRRAEEPSDRGPRPSPRKAGTK